MREIFALYDVCQSLVNTENAIKPEGANIIDFQLDVSHFGDKEIRGRSLTEDFKSVWGILCPRENQWIEGRLQGHRIRD